MTTHVPPTSSRKRDEWTSVFHREENGVHQTISEDDIKTELAKNNVKIINKVQRLKFNGQPTRKVVIQFENEQDMKIALYSGIYFGRIRIRCESYRTTPQVTQCYTCKCQGFNHIAKDCKMHKNV